MLGFNKKKKEASQSVVISPKQTDIEEDYDEHDAVDEPEIEENLEEVEEENLEEEDLEDLPKKPKIDMRNVSTKATPKPKSQPKIKSQDELDLEERQGLTVNQVLFDHADSIRNNSTSIQELTDRITNLEASIYRLRSI